MIDQPPLALCGWPGLAGLWLRGRWPSLMVAVGFSFLFNLALVSTFVWPALLGDSVRTLLWPILAVAWAIGAWNSWRMLNGLRQNGPETTVIADPGSDDTLFIQAQTEYLKGDYQQSESLLAQRLQEDNRDVESRLLLASVFERSGRLEKAARQLDMLGRLDESRQWRFEIDRLRQRIQDEIENRDDLDSPNPEEHNETQSSRETDFEETDHNETDFEETDHNEVNDNEGDLASRTLLNHEGQSESGKVKLGQAQHSRDSEDRLDSARLDLEDQEDLTDPQHNFDDHFGDNRRAA